MTNIENIEKLTKEKLIITLLKSESSTAERNFEKPFNNNTDNNTYDDKIRSKISNIRKILNRLGNILTKKDRKDIKKMLYDIEKKKNVSDKDKEEIYDYLVNLVKILDNKEIYINVMIVMI